MPPNPTRRRLIGRITDQMTLRIHPLAVLATAQKQPLGTARLNAELRGCFWAVANTASGWMLKVI